MRPWARHCGFLSFISPWGANTIMPSLPPSAVVASPQFLRTRQWTWVVTTQLLCISEWLALNFINRKEVDCSQGVPEEVSSPRASLHVLLSKPYWSGAAETRLNARLSFSLLNLGDALWPPQVTWVSQASVLTHFVSKQFFSRAWAQQWPGADLKRTPVPNAHSLAPLYTSWHWPQTGFCQKLPEKVAFHSSWLKGTLDDKYLPHLITETVSKPMEED